MHWDLSILKNFQMNSIIKNKQKVIIKMFATK
jgi:hypothetical protein